MNDLPDMDHVDLRPKMRSYHIRIKQKRSELDDYELSNSYFTQRKLLEKEALEKLRRLFINSQESLLL